MQFQTLTIFNFRNLRLMDWNQTCSMGAWQCFFVFYVGTLCSTKIKRPDISYVPLMQSRDVQLPS